MAVRPARAVALSRSQPNAFARDLFGGLPRRYDVLESVLSFGQNHRGRTAMVDAVVRAPLAPGLLLDVATGTAGGDALHRADPGAGAVEHDRDPQVSRGGGGRERRAGAG